MTIDDLNASLGELSQNPSWEKMLATAVKITEWMGIKIIDGGAPRIIVPHIQEMKKHLMVHPQRKNQHLLYLVSEKNQSMAVCLAVLKKIKKDSIRQLVDKERALKFQTDPPIIQKTASANHYLIYLLTTPAFDGFYLLTEKGDQKRILQIKNKFSQTQYQKIIPQWKNIAAKSKPEIAEQFWNSLDLKEVNKDFYKLVKEQFDALQGIAKVHYSEAREEDVKQFAVRLIGRYIFCWFLKEKGIIPEKLLASETIAQTESFDKNVLIPLFFNTLNTPVPERKIIQSFIQLNHGSDTIPYLNGGLFERHQEDILFNHIDLNDWLKCFVKVLEGFDFTVDESSSRYQQVAIDPEMLGRIFENLLASQNPETEKMANQRKAYGAFYTPREIVDYMVNESLKAHLETQLLQEFEEKDDANAVAEPLLEYKGTLFECMEPQQNLIKLDGKQNAEKEERQRKRERLKEKIDKLFAADCTENPFDKEETPKAKKALSNITILDPACGSGAFPMGMMLRLMELRQIVGHGHRNNYDLKEEILSKNIFGVDIMPMAVEIARLRAWLSLVLEAEYKPADRKNNFGIAALPNLDFKFVCANSLIDSGYDDFRKKIDLNQTLYRLSGEIQKLERIRDEYFDPKGDKSKKKSLQDEFAKTKNYIKEQISVGNLIKNYKLVDFFNKVDDWNPFDDSKPSSFFSTAWMFGIQDGFDVVIGNPPYIQMQKDNGRLADQLKDAGYKTFERTGDVYAIFYELGFNILKEKGIHTFITSSQWMKASYGKSLQKLFLSKNPLKLIAMGPGIFESAVVDTTIFIAKNEKNTTILKGSTIEKPEQLNQLDLLPFDPMSYVTVGNWAILGYEKQSINEKIKIKGKPLREWDIKINFGIKTGYNEAFIIDETKRNELVQEDKKSDEIVRPILRGREIEKFFTDWDGGYIISTFPAMNIDINNYKAVKKYLEYFLPKINQTGETFINSEGIKEKTRKKTGNKWYETQDQIGYFNELSKEKMIWKRIGSQLRFSYSDSEIYCLDSTCIATGEKIKYLTALLNSRLCNHQLFETAPKTGMGDLIISVQALEPLLVYYPKDKEQKQIEKLVDEIIQKKKQNHDTTDLEKEIDILVYKLYDLSYDEVKIVDPEFWLTQEEYGKIKLQ